MKKLILFTSIAAVLYSCGGETESKEMEENSTSTTEIDSAAVVDSSIVELPDYIGQDTAVFNNLYDFFSIEMCYQIRELNKRFWTYNTNDEFEQILYDGNAMIDTLVYDFYDTETKFKDELPQEFQRPETMASVNAFEDLKDSLLPLTIECGGECVEVAFYLDFEGMRPTLRTTPSEADDELVEILRRVYGVYADFRWMNMTGWRDWMADDSFWYTFGNNYTYNLLKGISDLEQKFPGQFERLTNQMKDDLIAEMNMPAGSKTIDRRAYILDEFYMIRDEIDGFNAYQIKEIDRAIKYVETTDEIEFEYEW